DGTCAWTSRYPCCQRSSPASPSARRSAARSHARRRVSGWSALAVTDHERRDLWLPPLDMMFTALDAVEAREMVSSAGSGSGGIFISYRRQEADYVAGRLFDHLANRFGEQRVFMDVDSIEPGLDFGEAIEQAVSSCSVLLALIGQQWLTMTD